MSMGMLTGDRHDLRARRRPLALRRDPLPPDGGEHPSGSAVEVNVVDPFVRKGYRFKGPAMVYEPGTALYAEALDLLRRAGSSIADRVRAIVVIEVARRGRSSLLPTTTASPPRPTLSRPTGRGSLASKAMADRRRVTDVPPAETDAMARSPCARGSGRLQR
jgi:hypothetical protein